MKVYLVTEADLERLREKLELTKFREEHSHIDRVAMQEVSGLPVVDQIHRAFNFDVCRWSDEIKNRKGFA